VPHGGGQDFWHLIDFLRQRHNVYLITFDDPVQPVPRAAIAPFVRDLAIIPYARAFHEKGIAWAGAILRGYRHRKIGRRYWEARNLVRRWIARYEIDVLHCGWTEMGACLDAADRFDRPVVRVFDEVEVRFLADQSGASARMLSAAQIEKRKQEEIAYCQKADLVLTRSERDLGALREHLPDLNGMVLPPVGNTDEFLTIQPEEAQPFEILFCGALNREANIEGLTWFVEHVWPLVQRRAPASRLVVVGAHPTAAVTALGSRPGVAIIGYASDLRSWYARARVVIAPVFVIGGSQNKVRDGLAAGRPVVATSAAQWGVDAPCVLVADDPATFAETIIRLIMSEAFWRASAEASRHFARANFQWRTSAAALEARYRQLWERKTAQGRWAHHEAPLRER
jgi:glycosyltransferase involved in cell wall biosynthesis